MSGVCITVGVTNAKALGKQMLSKMARNGQQTKCVLGFDDCVGGKAYHGHLKTDSAPVTYEDNLTVLIEGEIFNAHGPVIEPSMTIASLYRTDSLDQVSYLNGSFSVIIIDARKNIVILLTDRLASRSLFVYRQGTILVAASRMVALLSHNKVPRKISKQGLVELLSYQRTLAEQTQYVDIRSMPSAAIWSFKDGNLIEKQSRKLKWASPQFSPQETVELLANALVNATKRRTSDSAKHGLLLSGGLDSRLVLSAVKKTSNKVNCLTTSLTDNYEVGIARGIAKKVEMPFQYIINNQKTLSDKFDEATDASDGLFVAPINLYSVLSEITRDHNVLLSGHGLDYTFRGYYLPCKTLKLSGSNTRLPMLKNILNGKAETIAESLRVGIPAHNAKRVVIGTLGKEWNTRQVRGINRYLANVEIDNPYNAWDAFILHNLGRHYAYSDYVGIESYAMHREITFDQEVFDIYLSMPPEWRASGKIIHKVMCQLGNSLMAFPDANTGLKASYDFWLHIIFLLSRGLGRRLGVIKRPEITNPIATQGSWPDFSEVLRRDPGFLKRLKKLTCSSVLFDTGLFDQKNIQAIVNEHLERKASHKHLLLQLLTLDSWLERNGYTAVA